MLAAQGIIAAEDHAAIQRGMAQITQEIESGAFAWKLDLEDVHLNIEARLTSLVGDAGKRLHTGRSRNDQVATDVRLWLRDEIAAIGELLTELQRALVAVGRAQRRGDPARFHAPAGGTAGEFRPPPAGLRRECTPAMPSAWSTCAAAPTACRWAPRHWPAPVIRWIASASPAPWAWRACARTAWMPSATAISRSNSPPPPRSACCTSRVSARNWCCG